MFQNVHVCLFRAILSPRLSLNCWSFPRITAANQTFQFNAHIYFRVTEGGNTALSTFGTKWQIKPHKQFDKERGEGEFVVLIVS